MSDPKDQVPSVSVSDLTNLIKGDKDWLEDIQDKIEKGEITEEQWMKVQQFFVENQYGPVQPSIICKDRDCPYIKACHPPGTLIRTANRGDVPIENLDPFTDKIVTYVIGSNNGGSHRYKSRGRGFSLHERDYSGDLVHIEAGGKTHACTTDHISLARWSPYAKDLFVVYLMAKGPFYRIGKTTLLKSYDHANVSGITMRANAEQADSMWVLGIYNTNTEALLAEERLSVVGGIPKALFIATPPRSLSNNNDGLYRWVTQDQLDRHHLSCLKPKPHYKEFLSGLGLDIDLPIWSREQKDTKNMLGSASKTLQIRSCNLIDGAMEVGLVGTTSYKDKPQWYVASIKRTKYSGVVYSLGVEKEHTYIANGIITHNCPLARAEMPLPTGKPCPIEESSRTLWFRQLSKEIGTTEDGFDATDLGAACDIINILIQKQRVQWELVKNPEVSQQVVIGMNQGQPIVDNKANPAFFALKALGQMQLKLNESLLTTREARSKDKSRKTQDAATQYAALKEVVDRTKQLKQTNPDGSPVPIFDIISKLPKNQSSDERLNRDQE